MVNCTYFTYTFCSIRVFVCGVVRNKGGHYVGCLDVVLGLNVYTDNSKEKYTACEVIYYNGRN